MHKVKRIVYTPESGIRNPRLLLEDFMESLPQMHALGYRLFLRNLKGMYRQSLLGLFWSVIPPLVTSLIWIFLNGQRVVDIDVPGISYPLFVIIGTILWQTFAEGVNGPVRGVTMGKSMLAKINFPRESLILSGIYEVIFNVLIKIGLIALVFVTFQQMPAWSTLFSLLGFASLILLGSTIGLLLTPLAMLYNDIQKGIVIVLQFAIYLTPVIYPEPKSGLAAQLMQFNPVAPLLTTTRNLLIGAPTPNLETFFWVSGASVVLFLLGLLVYRLAMPIIIERIGS
ncbi:ABC transporter permease [Catalinimonas niigatensis]|uniref:ABC transporter permease n=1 Tax=Catalinimonas niigatensis TaxID=1397264 RepID=UPI0026666988|nr:ABC transporter permease [Catalinimonas niigatensis]WPP52635.1 ABC transporter permease [Catalinimonas niigatensis]